MLHKLFLRSADFPSFLYAGGLQLCRRAIACGDLNMIESSHDLGEYGFSDTNNPVGPDHLDDLRILRIIE